MRILAWLRWDTAQTKLENTGVELVHAVYFVGYSTNALLNFFNCCLYLYIFLWSLFNGFNIWNKFLVFKKNKVDENFCFANAKNLSWERSFYVGQNADSFSNFEIWM